MEQWSFRCDFAWTFVDIDNWKESVDLHLHGSSGAKSTLQRQGLEVSGT